MTSVFPSPLKSPARTGIFGFVDHCAHWDVLKAAWPLDRPTHRPLVEYSDSGTSNFMPSVFPSPLKSPARTGIFGFVYHCAHCDVTKFPPPSDSPTQRPLTE